MEKTETVEKIPILLTSSAVQQGPGPAAYDTRTKIQGKPQTIGHRYEEKVDPSSPPFVALPSTIGQGQKYTIGNRPKESTAETTPGPSYEPPQFGAESSRPSIGSRWNTEKTEVTPGPSDYMTSKGLGGKGIAFHGPRNRSMAVPDRSPGPGAYDTLNCSPSTSPRYSIGKRVTTEKSSDGPGPGAYDTRSGIEVKKYGGVIGVKTKNSTQEVTPGPSDYERNDDLLNSIPKVHIGGRYETKPSTETPGPYTIKSNIGNGPKYSMRSRPKDSQSEQTPGVDYMPPAFGTGSSKLHIASRWSYKEDEHIGPGPASYTTSKGLLHTENAPVFHGPSNRSLDVADRSPGPACYNPVYSNNSPRISIKGNGKSRDVIQKSGEYVVLKSTLTGPKYTISPRTNLGVSFG